jgi:hypothetical protein
MYGDRCQPCAEFKTALQDCLWHRGRLSRNILTSQPSASGDSGVLQAILQLDPRGRADQTGDTLLRFSANQFVSDPAQRSRLACMRLAP